MLLAPHISGPALDEAVTLVSGEGASPGVGIGVVVRDFRRGRNGARMRSSQSFSRAHDESGGPARHDRIARRRHRAGRQHVACRRGRSGARPALRCRLRQGRARRSRRTHRHGRRRTGKVYDGALAIEAPDESDHEVADDAWPGWAAARSPLRVSSAVVARKPGTQSISPRTIAAADPTMIGEVLKASRARAAFAAARSLRTRACAARLRSDWNSSSPILFCRRCSRPSVGSLRRAALRLRTSAYDRHQAARHRSAA